MPSPMQRRARTTTLPFRPSMVSAMSVHALNNSMSSLRSTSAAQRTRRCATRRDHRLRGMLAPLAWLAMRSAEYVVKAAPAFAFLYAM